MEGALVMASVGAAKSQLAARGCCGVLGEVECEGGVVDETRTHRRVEKRRDPVHRDLREAKAEDAVESRGEECEPGF